MFTILSPGSDVWKYFPITPKVCTVFPSWVSIINDANNASSAIVGDAASSRGICFWGTNV